MGHLVHETYNEYQKELKVIEEFYELTIGTYEICSTITKAPRDFCLEKFSEAFKDCNVSYCPADINVESVELLCEWVSIKEYASRYDIDESIVISMCNNGKCGPVIEKNGKKYIVWPKEHQNDINLPPVDKKKFRTRIARNQQISVEMDNEQDMIAFMQRRFRNIEKVTENAKMTLNRETFLLYWTAFEQYIAQIAFVLFEIYPEEVFKNRKYSKDTMSYLMIYEQSKKLTDIAELRQYILDSIISKANSGNKNSVNKTIQFISDCYMSKDIDPYKSYYIYKNERIDIDFSMLDEIRRVRNVLVHERGKIDVCINSFNIFVKTVDGCIIVDDDMLSKVHLILKAIGFNIYNCLKKDLK